MRANVPAVSVIVPVADHVAAAADLVRRYRELPPEARVRLGKPSSNLFRFGAPPPTLDASGLSGVISVDPVARTADVAGMTTYEDLVDATLPHGLMPLVVPQLKTITLGGAVAGLGIESTSFRNGLPHESVREMEILTGAGEVVTATPGRRARRPVPRLPELLRHPGLRAAADDRPAARQPLRPAAAPPLPRREGLHGRDRRALPIRTVRSTSSTAPSSTPASST